MDYGYFWGGGGVANRVGWPFAYLLLFISFQKCPTPQKSIYAQWGSTASNGDQSSVINNLLSETKPHNSPLIILEMFCCAHLSFPTLKGAEEEAEEVSKGHRGSQGKKKNHLHIWTITDQYFHLFWSRTARSTEQMIHYFSPLGEPTSTKPWPGVTPDSNRTARDGANDRAKLNKTCPSRPPAINRITNLRILRKLREDERHHDEILFSSSQERNFLVFSRLALIITFTC